jgi:hypothetical protein
MSVTQLAEACIIMQTVCPERHDDMVSFLHSRTLSHFVRRRDASAAITSLQTIASVDSCLAEKLSRHLFDDFLSTSNRTSSYEPGERHAILARLAYDPYREPTRLGIAGISHGLLSEFGIANPFADFIENRSVTATDTPASFLLRILEAQYVYGLQIADCLGIEGVATLASRLALPHLMAEFVQRLARFLPDIAKAVAERLVEETALPEDWQVRYPAPDTDGTLPG